jgi:hypothetical protein
MYPVAAFTSGQTLQLGVAGTALLTISYQGLFDLAKRFLDPYHNENFWSGDDAVLVDTLLAEVNAGSMRWLYGLDEMPIPGQSFSSKTNLLDDYILPDEGYTKQEAADTIEQRKVAREAEAVTGKMTQSEFEQKVTEIYEAAEEEYTQTQRILNAPPGSDFVPGLDDDGESLKFYKPLSDEKEDLAVEVEEEEDDSGDRFEKYLNATVSERKSKRRQEV